ncbi:hypothetical protein WA158_000347 [Blastocystis sp. Blastoise]
MSIEDKDLVSYEDVEDLNVANPLEEEQVQTDAMFSGINNATFKDFNLRDELLTAISKCGFENPSEVQQQAIPKAIAGSDLLVQAKSGMGKTAVFVLATLQKLTEGDYVDTLVLCHTRELAYQIRQEYERFSQSLTNVHTAVFFGGVPVVNNQNDINSIHPNIVVGTPGRILDLVNRKCLDLSHIKHFIVDECDKVIDDIDMRRVVQDIFKQSPRDKQVMMFTATLNEDIAIQCQKFMVNPAKLVVLDEKKDFKGLKQYYFECPADDKLSKLEDLLDHVNFNQVAIFCNSTYSAKSVYKYLIDRSFPPMVLIYGGLNQQQRLHRFEEFKSFKARILISTNLLGRGIDVEKINLVINYDFPQEAATYLHRVGRAGRFGTEGIAISFIATPEDMNIKEEVVKTYNTVINPLPENIDADILLLQEQH